MNNLYLINYLFIKIMSVMIDIHQFDIKIHLNGLITYPMYFKFDNKCQLCNKFYSSIIVYVRDMNSDLRSIASCTYCIKKLEMMIDNYKQVIFQIRQLFTDFTDQDASRIIINLLIRSQII